MLHPAISEVPPFSYRAEWTMMQGSEDAKDFVCNCPWAADCRAHLNRNSIQYCSGT